MKKILLVGQRHITEMAAKKLSKAGYTCEFAGTMLDAVNYLRHAPDAKNTQLFVQENLAMYSRPNDIDNDIEKLKGLHGYDRGQGLIEYVRKKGLIADTTPAYLATSFEDYEKFDPAPEGVTRVIRLTSEQDIATQMAPSVGNHNRGGSKPSHPDR